MSSASEGSLFHFSPSFISLFPPSPLRGVPHVQHNIPSSLPHNYQQIIVEEIKNNNVSQNKVSKYLKISRKKIYRILSKFKEGKFLNENKGRPPIIDNEHQIQIKNEIIQSKLNKNCLNEGELKNLLYEKAKDTLVKKGENGILKQMELSNKTIKNYINKLEITKEKGQKTTMARRDASLDIRNFLSMAVMNHAYCSNLSSHCIGNMDSTQFLLKFTDQQKLISIDKLSPTTKTEESTLDLFIRQFFLVNAVGYTAPPLFVFSNDHLNDSEFILILIDDLSFSFDSKTTGYIIFCHSRMSNSGFYKWLFKEYIVKNIQIFKSRQSTFNSFYLTLDGEATQIQTLDDTEVLSILNDNNIDIGKGPASCSGCCSNALDCGNFFKSIKTSLTGKSGIGQEKSTNSELENNIINELNKFNDKLKLSYERKNKISKGIVHLMEYEMKCLNFSIIRKSFETIGMVGENKLEQTLSCCTMYKTTKIEQLNLIKSSMDHLVNIFKLNGEIKDSEYDTLGIMKLENKENEKNRDELVIYRQRAVLLTLKESIQRRKNYFEEKQRKEEEVILRKKSKEEEKEQKNKEKIEKENEKKRKREEKMEENNKKLKLQKQIQLSKERKTSLRLNKWSKKSKKKPIKNNDSNK